MIKNLIPNWLHIPNREDNIFSLVFLIILTVPLVFVSFLPEGYETVKYAALVALTGIGAIALATRKEIHYHKTLLVLLGLLWLLHLASTILSIDVINSVMGLYGRYTGSIFFITGWVLLIVLIWNAIKQDETRRISLMRVLVFDAMAVAVFSIIQYFNFIYYGGPDQSVRSIIPSFIGNQNFYSMFLVAVFPAMVLLANQAKNLYAKIYYILVAAISIWAIVLAGSRGGLLGFGAMSLVFLFVGVVRKYPKPIWIITLASIALTAVLYLGFFSTTRTESNSVSATSVSEQTINSRYMIWDKSLEIIANQPWFGTGSGNLFIAFGNIADFKNPTNERFDDAHNMFLNIGTTVGLPALALFLVIIFYSMFQAWKESKYLRTSAIWALAAMAGILVAGSFNPVSISTWVVVAMITAFTSSYTTIRRNLVKYWKIALAIVGVGALIFGVCFISSDALTVYGTRAYRNNADAESVRYLSYATKLNPFNTAALVRLTAAKINLGGDDKDQRVKEIQKIINQHPNSSGNTKIAGDLVFKLYKATNDAQLLPFMNELYEKAIVLEPSLSVSYNYAAYAYYKTDQPDKALEVLDKQQEIITDQEDPYSWILRSKIYFDRGQKEETVQAFEKAYEQLTDQLVFKYFLRDLRATPDIKTLRFPMTFPDIDV